MNGRLTLNPISHIDWIGLMLLLTVRVGWAKPVPVDMRNFRHPKRDMAITALAGPAANFLLATAALGVASPDLSLRASGDGGGLCHLFLPVYGGAQCRAGDL